MKDQIFAATLRALSLAPLALACATAGTATGELHEPNKQPQSVTLNWKSDADLPERGSMSGTLPDGKHYAGRYYEVVKNVPEEVYAGAWGGSEPYWPDWPIASPSLADKTNWDTFAATYSGRVMATLTSSDGTQTIRCRFTVTTPSAGLVRGGSGECKLSDGATIQNVVLSRN